MLEFDRRVFEFKLDGKKHVVKSPTVRQIEELQKKSKDAPGLEETIDFLEQLGLDKDVAYSMEPWQLQKVVEEVSGAEEKK